MAQGEGLGCGGKVTEAVDLLGVGTALRRVDLEVVEICAASAREEEAGGVTLELEVLHVVIMSGEIELYIVFAEEWIPFLDEDRMITVGPVRVDRMMAEDSEKWRRARLLQLMLEPGELLDALFISQREVTAGSLRFHRMGHVAIERNKGDERLVRGEVEAVPARGHDPARFGSARIF